MHAFSQHNFESQLERSLTAVRKIISTQKNPIIASKVPHVYEDKFLLAKFLTNSFISANIACLFALGVTEEQMNQLRTWAADRTVTLRLSANEVCTFAREVTTNVDSKTKNVTEVIGVKLRSKVVTTVKEYFWNFVVDYQLTAYVGNGAEAGESISIRRRIATHEIKTSSDKAPKKENLQRDPIECNISWLFTHLNGDFQPLFDIDRRNSKCFTPRRNEDIDGALTYACQTLFYFCRHLTNYFVNDLFPVHSDNNLDLKSMNDENIFMPVLPLLMEVTHNESSSVVEVGTKRSSSTTVEASDLQLFLIEQRQTLQKKLELMLELYPASASQSIISSAEGEVVVIFSHLQKLCTGLKNGIYFIEEMIRSQLIAAVGREITPADLREYMLSHNKKIFKPQYVPVPFSYAVRRSSEHSPEGVISIEESSAASSPIYTITDKRVMVDDRATNMEFALGASTRISFGGERHLHAWLNHTFSGSSPPNLKLVCDARQFSSFIILIGRISSAKTFDPKSAFIVKDKDSMKIPLNLEQIPSAKEFKDSIKSLSPEQQRFAQAFRSMQLESTMFGICVIQIKPQLEKVLKLAPDSLTKEIKLNQDLMDLFINYQIPSDLLCFSGDDAADNQTRLVDVNKNVAAIQAMIQKSKTEEIKEAGLRFDYEHPELMSYSLNCLSSEDDFSETKSAPTAPTFLRCSTLSANRIKPNLDSSVLYLRTACGSSAFSNSSSSSSSRSSNSSTNYSSNFSGQKHFSNGDSLDDMDSVAINYTQIPTAIEGKFESLGNGDVRPTIIHPSRTWTKVSQKSLLSQPETVSFSGNDQDKEKKRAFDLLDALTKSGALTVDNASLHVVMAYTHCFDSTIIDTIVKDNINPIEKVEKSTLILGGIVHNQSVGSMIKEAFIDKVLEYSPMLI